jgi:3-methylfumaryl-CoA hydratase
MANEFDEWIGRSETLHDALAPAQAALAMATLDETALGLAEGSELPLPWHWFYFLPRAAQSDLDVDGHPRRGGFLPPIPFPRRMFAGARLTQHRPLRIGSSARREGTIRDVVMKSGKSGALAFVTVGYRFVQDGELCLEEEQDIVYREPGARVPAPVQAPWPPLPEDAWSRTLEPDTRLLFRFSALTFNAHRIHYDRAYAIDAEGYPGLVVHGPLNAVLLLQLVRQHSPRPVRGFEFRGLAPLFDLGPMRLSGVADGDRVTLQSIGIDAKVAMAATAMLG